MVIGSIRNNISALEIISRLYSTENRLQTNLERISSGLRINSAADDPGGLTLSSKLETQYRGLYQANENVQNVINLTNTALSGVDQIVDLLNDIRDAAVAASGGSAAQQTVINEKLEEINSIADDTKFDGYYLLNGSMTTDVDFKSGTRDFGASLAFGPNATTLFSGRSYLNLSMTTGGSQEIKAGTNPGFQTGITIASDIAVTTAQFINGAAVAGTGDNLVGLTVNHGVSLQDSGMILFSGTLADGTTEFSGAYSITGTSQVSDLISSIQSSIDSAETDLGIDGTGVLETTAGLDAATGRLQFHSGTDQNISEFDLDITVKNPSGTIQTTFGTDRADDIYNYEVIATSTSGAKIGNNVTAITGSTFDSGTFDITVSNVVAEQRRQIESTNFDRNLGGPTVNGNTNLHNSYINTQRIENGDTFLIEGTDPDGTTFSVEYTVDPTDAGAGDALISDYDSLIDELNVRDRSKTGYGFNGTLTELINGKITLTDDIADSSSTSFQITVTDVSLGTTEILNPTVNQAGTRETATVSIDGGTAVEVTAGDVVTLQGVNASGGPLPEVTLRMGSGFAAGIDALETTAKEFVGQLNGGELVTFQNGDTSVRFQAGEASIYPIKQYQQVTLDFDAILDVTTSQSAGGETFVLSTTSNPLNFQIGGERDDVKLFLFADLHSENLGTSSSANLDSVDVTTASGATAALDIIDDALDQVNEFNARLGAFSSRLDDTSETLSTGSTNLQTAYTQILSADIAQETTELTLNSILLQAQAAVLSQANTSAVSVFEILYGLD